MSQLLPNTPRVLAIDLCSRGFGFTVLEGPERLIEWGVKSARRDRHTQCLTKVTDLVEHYRPGLLVLEAYVGQGARRPAPVRALSEAIRGLATNRKLKVRTFSRVNVRKVFRPMGAATREQIARVLAKQFPELAPHVPPVRKPWMSEKERSNIFDAVSLALSYFYLQTKRTRVNSVSLVHSPTHAA